MTTIKLTCSFTIDQTERNIQCADYIHKYIIMYRDGFLKSRKVRRMGALDFEVDYEFNLGTNQAQIDELLKDKLCKKLN